MLDIDDSSIIGADNQVATSSGGDDGDESPSLVESIMMLEDNEVALISSDRMLDEISSKFLLMVHLDGVLLLETKFSH